MKSPTIILFPLIVASYVAAHGNLWQVTIQGAVYPGNPPSGPTNPSVIRQATTQDPIKGATNPALPCGVNATPATLVADAMPGDTLTFTWKEADGGIVRDVPSCSFVLADQRILQWPHNIGPLMTYMTSCGSVTPDNFDTSNAKWFKIDEQGQEPNGTWVQNELYEGGVSTVQLPQNIASGPYLLRNEIIALHLATSLGGAEFYEGCVQLNIGGNENGVPPSSDLVSIPGLYSDNDPGIYDPDVFNPGATYTFPGPPVATLVSNQSSPSTPGSTTNICRLKLTSQRS